MRIEDLDTPTLLVDLDTLQDNLKKMSAVTADTGTFLRPHFKAYKCIPIVERQRELGAIGVTCAKLSEAEVLADHGFDHLLVANEVCGDVKVRRLVELRKRVDVMVGVDSLIAAETISSAAVGAGVKVPVLVDVDLGMNRCGTTPEGAIELAQRLVQMQGVEFRGLMGYEGHLIAMQGGEDKVKAVNEALDHFVFVKQALASKGIDVGIVSAGGTGDYRIAAQHPVVTELQVGSYTLMDTLYGAFQPDFKLAATILCTVISRPAPDRLVIDVGRKGVNTQLNLSALKNRPSVALKLTYAEHGEMEVKEEAADLQPGVKVELEMPYADGTVHLYENMHLVRDGEVVDVWPIVGRGKLQ